MRRIFFGMTAVLIASTACATPSSNQRNEGDDMETMRAMLESQESAALAGDADGYVAVYAEDAVVFLPGGAATKTEIREMFSISTIRVEEVDFEMTEMTIMDEIAYTHGRHRSTNRVAGRQVEQEGSWMAIWRSGPDGRWLVWRSMWNLDPGPG